MTKLIMVFVAIVLASCAATYASLTNHPLRSAVIEGLSVAGNLFTIATASLALVVFFRSREKITLALQLLLNFSFLMTLGELKEKLERLNEYRADEPNDLVEIKNILHEISGQIRGNDKLIHLMPLAIKAESLADSKRRLGEPSKRSFVSELREKLRTIQVNSSTNFESGPNV